jgi:hypothetical protein
VRSIIKASSKSVLFTQLQSHFQPISTNIEAIFVGVIHIDEPEPTQKVLQNVCLTFS